VKDEVLYGTLSLNFDIVATSFAAYVLTHQIDREKHSLTMELQLTIKESEI
jgi:hypothetical protein